MYILDFDTLKGIYNFVHDMVVRSCASGCGCDPKAKSTVAKKEVWKAYTNASYDL